MKSRAFTLVELLVVISIISLLIALLLPALAWAHKAADQVACSSNLRQLGQAVYEYSDEYDGYLPLTGTGGWYGYVDWGEYSNGQYIPMWDAQLDTVMMGNQASTTLKVFACPTCIEDAGWNGTNWANGFRPGLQAPPRTYAINSWITGVPPSYWGTYRPTPVNGSPANVAGPWNIPGEPQAVKQSAVNDGSEVALIADNDDGVYPLSNYQGWPPTMEVYLGASFERWADVTPPHYVKDVPGYFRGWQNRMYPEEYGTENVLFVDGHVDQTIVTAGVNQASSPPVYLIPPY